MDESKYSKVFQLGFRTTPNKVLHKYIAEQAGVSNVPGILYYYPQIKTLDDPYIVIAPHSISLYERTYKELYDREIFEIVMVGSKGEYPGFGINMCGADFLDILSWLGNSSGFIGRGANYVLAEGFTFPTILPHIGNEFNFSHLIQDERHFYPINPTVSQLMEILGKEVQLSTFSKTLNLDDYLQLDGYSQHITNMLDHFNVNNIPYGAFNHEHRKWEYGMVYKALDANKSKIILDIGGAGAIFAPSMAWVGISVHQIDTEDSSSLVNSQNPFIPVPITFEKADFVTYENTKKYDAVIAISVIEHVIEDEKFFRKMLSLVNDGGLVCLTTDFHPSGTQIVPFHLRTYNKESLLKLSEIAKEEGFEFFKGKPSYNHFAENVNGCTFASLIMKRA
jgi:2-polyprenyl-3-methyl-5-hydroxy-6-metoxy-1,4-benzoquinol methylase